MKQAFLNGRIFAQGQLLSDHALLTEGAWISGVLPIDDERLRDAAPVDVAGAWLLPGFIDTQVNGGGGVLFNDAPTVEGIRAIGAAHARFGTTGFLPTLISDELGVIGRAIAAVDAAIAAGVPGVLGIHIEGPFLNSARRGIHDAAHIRSIDEDAVRLLSSLRRGKTLVTLAPEAVSASLLRQLDANGVIVNAGHTNATFDQVRAAQGCGLRGFTHLFNAMSPLTAREPGAVGAALTDDESFCGIIVDGRHVDPRTLRIALRAKSLDRFMLVTDAMPPVGTTLAHFELLGRRIEVRDDHCAAEDGTLAGTTLDMSAALRNAMSMLGLDLTSALAMASRNPAQFLGLQATHGVLAAGMRADFVAADSSLHVVNTWIGGRPLPAPGHRLDRRIA